MKTRRLIITSILILIIGISSYIIFVSDVSKYTSKSNHNLQSKWNSTKSIGRMNNSNEKVSYKKVDIIVILDDKIIGDTLSIDPLIIDLSKDNIIIKSGVFSKSCNVNFNKKIQQIFNLSTDLTTIKTSLKGEIDYALNYEIKGICKYEKAEEIITDRIMNDIYKNAKNHIEFGLPSIVVNNLQIETPPRLIENTKLKL